MNRKKQILLAVIYLAFISLGLPDGILGVAWPSMRAELGMPLESVGILTTLLLMMSAFSSVVSGRVLGKWGTGGVTLLSGVMTGVALLGFSLSRKMIWLLLCTIPLGLGQGAVDSGLNLYVAKQYSARQMNWLHCFWGIGASLGPMIMTGAIAAGNWRNGYVTVSIIQLFLAAILLVSLLAGFWREENSIESSVLQSETPTECSGLYKGTDQALAILLFFLYSGIEFSIGIWLNSVLVESRGLTIYLAGAAVTGYYGMIMCGRFLSGMLVNRIGNINMIRIGIGLAGAGTICVGLSRNAIGALIGTALIGLGLAPVYPCLMHETPRRFRSSVNEKLIGYQVGAACLGGSIIASGAGVLLSNSSLEMLFPLMFTLLFISYAGNEILRCRAKQACEHPSAAG